VGVTIGYDVDWRTVESLLLKGAKATAEVSPDPPPTVLQTSFDDFGVSYLLRVHTGGPPPLGQIRTALGRNTLDEFNRAGVEILTPGVSVLRGGGQLAVPSTQDGAPEEGLAGAGESARDEDPMS
jgi:small-conductance mechanosensitive channel